MGLKNTFSKALSEMRRKSLYKAIEQVDDPTNSAKYVITRNFGKIVPHYLENTKALLHAVQKENFEAFQIMLTAASTENAEIDFGIGKEWEEVHRLVEASSDPRYSARLERYHQEMKVISANKMEAENQERFNYAERRYTPRNRKSFSPN